MINQRRLFPISRSITSGGNQIILKILQEIVALRIVEYLASDLKKFNIKKHKL